MSPKACCCVALVVGRVGGRRDAARMLTRLETWNFKQFEAVEIELGNPVVFIGPNNSGKTTALQALALWDLGMRRWRERNYKISDIAQSVGILNRQDFSAGLVPDVGHLWHSGKAKEKPLIIALSGAEGEEAWRRSLLFEFANQESFYCTLQDGGPGFLGVTKRSALISFAYLAPLSGLTDREFVKQPGEMQYLIGLGRTAEILRNICFQAFHLKVWDGVAQKMERLFGFKFRNPELIAERSEILLRYWGGAGGFWLDITSAGRGAQQVLLLLAFMAVNPNSVLLLDEPDAHLEILRQKEVYQLLTETAAEQGSQIIAASHSEVILNEAAQKDVLVSFVGKPHRVDDRGTQTLKALREIGFDQYQLAEITGWVLYLEGSTDLAILQSFARTLEHPAVPFLEKPFVHYVGNQPQKARDHFFGLREAKPNLTGLLICDKLSKELQSSDQLVETMWQRNEIENYLCQPETLIAFAKAELNRSESELAMQAAIEDLIPPAALRDREFAWWRTTKMSDDFLAPLFDRFYAAMGSANLMQKSNYHRLAPYVDRATVDSEVREKLDLVWSRALAANLGAVR